MPYVSKIPRYSEYIENQKNILIGDEAKKAREKMNISLADISKQLNVTEHMIQMFESGQKKSSNILDYYIKNFNFDMSKIDYDSIYNIENILGNICETVIKDFVDYVSRIISDYIYGVFLQQKYKKFENYDFAVANYIINHKYYIPKDLRRKERKTEEILSEAEKIQKLFERMDELNIFKMRKEINIKDFTIHNLIFNPIQLDTTSFEWEILETIDEKHSTANKDDLLTRASKFKETLYKTYSWKDITEKSGISKALLFKMFKGEKNITEKTIDLLVNSGINIDDDMRYYFTQTEPQYIINKYHMRCDKIANSLIKKILIKHPYLEQNSDESFKLPIDIPKEINNIKLINRVSDELLTIGRDILYDYFHSAKYTFSVKGKLVNKMFNL